MLFKILQMNVTFCDQISLIILFAFVLVINANGDIVAETSSYPRIHFSTTEMDFHDWPAEEPLFVQFTAENCGNQTLELFIESTSCGCFDASIEPEHVPPNSTAIVNMQSRPPSGQLFAGTKTMSLMLGTNDPDKKLIELRVNADLVLPLEFQPSKLTLEGNGIGAPISHSFIVKRYKRVVIPEITNIECPWSSFVVSCVSTEDKGTFLQDQFNVICSPDYENYDVSSSFIISTNSPALPLIEVPIKIQVQFPFEADPPQLIYGRLKKGTIKEARVKLSPRSSEVLEPMTCRSSDNAITVSLTNDSASGEWLLLVTLDTSVLPVTGPWRGYVGTYGAEEQLLNLVSLHALIIN